MRNEKEEAWAQPEESKLAKHIKQRAIVPVSARKSRDDNGPGTQDSELPVEQSMCVRPSSLVAFIFLAVCSEVVGKTRGLVVEKQEAFIPRLLSGACSACSIFLFREGRAMEEGVTASVVCALPSKWQPGTVCWSRKWSIRAFREG